MKTHLILIRGPLGIGKTTISKILAERENARYYSIDKMLEKAKLDRVDVKQGCIPLANFLAIQEDISPKIREILNNQSVVIDGNFYHKEQIDFFEKLFESKLVVVTLTAKLETCIKRDKKRDRPLGKKATEEVYKLVTRFDAGIIVDVENKSKERVVELIQGELI